MTQEQPKPLLFGYFGFEMQSEPQGARGVHLRRLLAPSCGTESLTHGVRGHLLSRHCAFSASRTGPGSQGSCCGLQGSEGSGALATLGADSDWSQL